MSITPDDDRPQRERLMDPTIPAAPEVGASGTREHPISTTTEPSRSRGRLYLATCAVGAVVAAVVGVVLLTGGGGDAGDAPAALPTAPPPRVTSDPATSPTVDVAPTAADLAVVAAEARYLDYLRVTRQVAQGGYIDLDAYDTVAVDPETGALLEDAAQLADITTTGNTEVVSLTVQSVELDPAGAYPFVRLLACLDVSQVTAVNADGESVVSPDRLDRIKSEVTVQNIPAGAFTDGREPGWYVAEIEQRGEPC